MNILATLRDRFRPVLDDLLLGGEGELQAKDRGLDRVGPLLEMIRPSQEARFGDYQANCAMSLKQQLGKSPREIAEEMIQKLDLDDVCEVPEIAGPGFINLRLRTAWLERELLSVVRDRRLGVVRVHSPRRIVIDFSSPNVAKPMHVGHIRSTVIGDALCRTLRFLGHEVISDNHIGDWGTQFGMIIYGFRHFVDLAAYSAQPVAELGRIYREVRALIDYHDGKRELTLLEQRISELETHIVVARNGPKSSDPKLEKQQAKQLAKQQEDLAKLRQTVVELQSKLCKIDDLPALRERAATHAEIGKHVLLETAKLHGGDPDNLRLWHEFLPSCLEEIDQVYQRLDVKFDHQLGESFYNDQLPGVVAQLQQQGLARESEGAVCVFLKEFDSPMIVQKKDGAYLYATTDLATIEYRMRTWKPDAIVYVVDFRQGDHFGKLFLAARAWGYQHVELTHVSFGTVLGDDGKPFRTRAGDVVSLDQLLDKGVERAFEIVCRNDDEKKQGPELSDEERRHVAQVVGIGAIKYADLSQNRTSDYVFSYDKMMEMKGNTATYLQYSYARIQGIFARVGIDPPSLRGDLESDTPSSIPRPLGSQGDGAQIQLSSETERALGIRLLQFSEVLHESMVDYRPNQLANYLYELAKTFAQFFEKCSVVNAESEKIRDSRILLCDLVARTLKQGLELLGIHVVNKM